MESPSYSMQDPRIFFQRCAINTSQLFANGMTLDTKKLEFNSDEGARKVILNKDIVAKVDLTDRELSVGQAHNTILASVDGTVTIKRDTPSPFTRSASDSLSFSDEELAKQILSSEEFMQLVENGDSSEDTNEKAEYAIKLFNEVFTETVSENDDVIYLINKYKGIIEASDELTDEEKESIYYALSTALYSYNYWYIQNKESNE